MEIINSKDNKKIKQLVALEKASKRKKEGLMVIEGKKEISLASKAGIEMVELYCSEEAAEKNDLGMKTIIIRNEIFQKIAYRENPDGFIALARMPQNDLASIKLKKSPFVLVLESVEKPGNIGAMLRTADACGADALILCSPTTDFYNPNVIRASLGAVFTVPVFAGSNEEVFDWLKKNKINIYCAGLKASVDFRKPEYEKPTAIVIGTEHEGLSDFWLDNSTENILIPMKGQIDSLNASVSAAIIMYEVERQRNNS